MKLFGQLVRTAVNTALLPVAFVRDVHDIVVGEPPTHMDEAIERLKAEAAESQETE
jgi:hypothetical protein